MDYFKKHVDSTVVISAIIGSVIWMNGKFNQIEKDIAIVQTVLQIEALQNGGIK